MWRIESRLEMLAMPLRPEQFKDLLRYHKIAYHYTPKENVESILANGLDPKYAGSSGWSGKPNFVYLWTHYEPEFLLEAGEGEPATASLAIDLSQLDPDKIYPDDDYVSEYLEGMQGDDADNMTWNSMQYGRFAYAGIIPPKAITFDRYIG